MLVILYTTLLIFFFVNIKSVYSALKYVFAVIAPILYGLVIAYLLNYPYKAFCNHVFKKMGTKHNWLKKIKKPLSLFLSYIIIFGIVAFLVSTLIPELSSSITTLIDNIPVYEEAVKSASDSVVRFILNLTGYNLYEYASYSNLITLITGNDTTEFIKNLFTEFIPSAFSTVLGIGTGLYNWGIGIIISIYLLASKERLLRQCKIAIVAYTPERFNKRFFKIADVFNNNNTSNTTYSISVTEGGVTTTDMASLSKDTSDTDTYGNTIYKQSYTYYTQTINGASIVPTITAKFLA